MSTLKAALLLVALSAPARVKAAPHCVPPEAIVRGSAPTIIGPLVPRWSSALAQDDPAMRVVMEPPFGPPQGALDPQLAAFLDGKSDFALLTREIAETDIARFKRAHGSAPLIIPIANGSAGRFGYVDPVVFIVNAANPLRALNFAQVDALFSSTGWRGDVAVVDWGALNGRTWRGKAVHLAGGGGWSGEESARALTVRRHVLSVDGKAGRWRASPGSGGEADVVARVASDPLAIGFTGLGHIAPGVRVVPIAARLGTNPVAPTRDAVTAGAYPLSRTVDIVLVPGADGLASPRLRRWVQFLVGPAGRAAIGAEGNFLPLRPGQIAQALRLAGPVRGCGA